MRCAEDKAACGGGVSCATPSLGGLKVSLMCGLGVPLLQSHSDRVLLLSKLNNTFYGAYGACDLPVLTHHPCLASSHTHETKLVNGMAPLSNQSWVFKVAAPGLSHGAPEILRVILHQEDRHFFLRRLCTLDPTPTCLGQRKLLSLGPVWKWPRVVLWLVIS